MIEAICMTLARCKNGAIVLSAVFAGLSAVCWILSASTTLPPMLAYWGGTPPSDPYQLALANAAFWNFWAAAFAAVAATSQLLSIGKLSAPRSPR
jgi:hypothetical protein